VLQSEVNMLKSKNVHQAGMPHGPLSSVDLNIMHQELSQVQIDVKNQIASTCLLTACMGAVAITRHGLTFSSHAETIAWVATKSTPGGYSCFYDVVSLLERVVTVTVTSTKAMDSRYRASRLGLTEMTAKSEAFYFIDIPTVFGKVSADSTSPQFPLPGVKDAKRWGGEDGVNSVSLTIQNALRAKQSTLTDAIVNAFLGYSATQRLAHGLLTDSFGFYNRMAEFMGAFNWELSTREGVLPSEAWMLVTTHYYSPKFPQSPKSAGNCSRSSQFYRSTS
jgi:hypothetical protein